MFAYVGCRTTRERNARGQGINVYEVDPASGRWTHVQLVRDLVNPSFLALDRTANFLFTVHGDFSEISSFAVDKHSGRLTPLNRQSTGGKNPVHLAVDPSNRFIVVSNHVSGTLAALPIHADGTLAPLTDLVEVHGEIGPHRSQQPGPRPHHNPFDRAGRFLVVPDKGLDEIFVFRLDTDAGKLVANDPPSVRTRPGAGPRHIDFHPNGNYAYVVNELDSTIAAYQYDACAGRLTPIQIVPSVPDTFVGENTGAEILVAPSGTFLYASNRGHDSIAVFVIEPRTGRLRPVGWAPTQGVTPRYFGVDPSGEFLYAANEESDSIVGFRIDEMTGRLTPTAHPVQTESPVCIVFSPADDRAGKASSADGGDGPSGG